MNNWLTHFFSLVLVLFSFISIKANHVEIPSQQACTSGSISMTDSLALVDLYTATNGVNWTTNWDLTTPICTWNGVTVSQDSILGLQLSNNNLNGLIPISLYDLSNLTMLDLSNNNLSGTLVEELIQLTQLETLYFNDNNFSGCFPISYTAWCDINVDFSNNTSLANNGDFSQFCTTEAGACPYSYISCRERDSINLVLVNQFTGGSNWVNPWDFTQPMDTWYGVTLNTDGCVNELILDNNNLNGRLIGNIGFLSNLETFGIINDNLSGVIPENIGKLEELLSLGFRSNKLTGTIPHSISNLQKLIAIHLDDNNLTGSLPSFLAELPFLHFINVSSNNLSGCIHHNFYRFCEYSNMDNLILNNNPNLMNGASSTDFCSAYTNACTPCLLADSLTLTEFHACSNNDTWINTWDIQQPVQNWYGVTTDVSGCVTEIDLSNNNLTGEVWEGFSNMSNLTDLNLSNNLLEGCFSDLLDPLCSINYDFTGNPNLANNGDFNSYCQTNIGACMPCRERDSLALVAFFNSTGGSNWSTPWDLTQPIDTWGGIALNPRGCVEQLETFGNNLTGSLPVEIGQLKNLKYLIIDLNYLSGILIPEIGDLQSLEVLRISYTDITGSLPSELGNLKNLRKLSIYSNNLSGTLPLSIGSLTKLNFLNISHENISGSIPPSFVNLTKLGEVYLNNNNLSGALPPFFANIQLGYVGITLQLQNNNFSGCIPQEWDRLCFLSGFGIINLSGNPNLISTDFEDFCEDNVGSCDCSPYYVFPNAGDTPSNSYEAQEYIHSSQAILNTNNVLFQAGDSIVLKAGFCVEQGAEFLGEINDCGN